MRHIFKATWESYFKNDEKIPGNLLKNLEKSWKYHGILSVQKSGNPVPGVSAPGGCLLLGGGGAWWRPPPTATAAGGTHPTGMHSCYFFVLRAH